MLIPTELVAELGSQLKRGGSAWVECDLDPLELVRCGQRPTWAGYVGGPNRQVGGLGVARRLDTSRVGELAEFLPGPGGATLFGCGFVPGRKPGGSWGGFRAASAVVPAVTAVRAAGRTGLSVISEEGHAIVKAVAAADPVPLDPLATPVEVSDIPTPEEWRLIVSDAIAAIDRGELEKVVLARTRLLRFPTFLHQFDLLAMAGTPSDFRFGWQEEGACLVGASPELLVRLDGLEVATFPMAGSGPRGSDLNGAVLRREHEAVVADVVARLSAVATLQNPPPPSAAAAGPLSHLVTGIEGRLTHATSLPHLVDLLHPTPAVGGLPREQALAVIDRLEAFERGWYAGAIGWMDSAGQGEAVVAVRSGLVAGDTLTLYAGAGIVAGMDPEVLVAETELKFRVLGDLFTNRGRVEPRRGPGGGGGPRSPDR